MFSLYLSLALLGLAAVDPIGIAIMPILLLQKHPFRRSFIFLFGSFLSLMIMGVAFAKGLGAIVLHFEKGNHWLIPTLELVAGAILLSVSMFVFTRFRKGKAISHEPGKSTIKRLKLNSTYLFLFGFALVLVQSIVDVVFLIAMVKLGQAHLSSISIVLAVLTYSVPALAMQLAVVIVFKLTPEQQKQSFLGKINGLLSDYSNQALIGASSLVGIIMLVLSIKTY
jgi:hypothetical protein